MSTNAFWKRLWSGYTERLHGMGTVRAFARERDEERRLMRRIRWAFASIQRGVHVDARTTVAAVSPDQDYLLGVQAVTRSLISSETPATPTAPLASGNGNFTFNQWCTTPSGWRLLTIACTGAPLR